MEDNYFESLDSSEKNKTIFLPTMADKFLFTRIS
jgi:hypothetical protein